MKSSRLLLALFVCLLALVTAQAQTASLHGLVTDPSGAAIPGAVVQAHGPNADARAKTDANGQYSFPTLPPGSYTIRVAAKGFAANHKDGVEVNGPATMDLQLTIESEAQVINVQD